MLGLMLLGMGASTVYFVSAGAQPEGRLSEIQAQLDGQNTTSPTRCSPHQIEHRAPN